MNTKTFLADPERYFAGSYRAFCEFGGPCVYFHEECLRAGVEAFLSRRHVEMVYATLTAWGMHRMGDSKTKLTNWDTFNQSILAGHDALQRFRGCRMLDMSVSEYSEAVRGLEPIYRGLNLSISKATVVVNSKALFHLLPQFVPPIDRQYTVRFFTQAPEQWRDRKGKFQVVALPNGFDEQFNRFHDICVRMKALADRVDPEIFKREHRDHRLDAPKAIDNAIVNYVTLTAGLP